MTLILHCEPYKTKTPAKVLEQGIELFGNRELFTPDENDFCALVFESWKSRFGRVAHHDRTKKLTTGPVYIYQYVCILCIWEGQSCRISGKMIKVTSTRKKKKRQP